MPPRARGRRTADLTAGECFVIPRLRSLQQLPPATRRPSLPVLADNYVPESVSARMLDPGDRANIEMRRVQIATRRKLQQEGSRKNPPRAFREKWTKAILTPRRSRRARDSGLFPFCSCRNDLL
jgi:hypothetical protein